MKILIMAGGSGERFWPLSTKENPKQLLSLITKKTMIRETIERFENGTHKSKFTGSFRKRPEKPWTDKTD